MSKCTGCHHDADKHQQAAAYDIDYFIVSFDPVEYGFEIIDKHGAEDERYAKAQRIGKQHQHALENMSLLGCQHQCGAEECANAGSPAQREDHAEDQRGEKVHILLNNAAFASSEQIDAEHTQEIQPEEDHNQTGDNVHCSLVRSQKTADSTGQRAENHKDHTEAGYEAKCSGQCFAGCALTAAREVRNINGQHGQKTRGDKGYDTFQKSDDILHSLHSFQISRQISVKFIR